MNTFRYEGQTLMCEDADLAAVAEQFGTPLYLYSKQVLVDACRDVESAFDGEKHLTCYAVKANNNIGLMEHIAREGLGADVASAGELQLALSAGFSPDRITMSGIGKRDDEITAALETGVRALIVESAEELEVINDIAISIDRKADILLRINLDIAAGAHDYVVTGTMHDKFGVPKGRAVEILRKAMAMSGLQVRGVHSHLGSQILDPNLFVQAAEELLLVIQGIRAAGIPVEHIDFGGGFGVQYKGCVQHPLIPQEQPESESFSISGMIRPAIKRLSQTGCSISIQPGRCIVAQSGVLLTRVLYRKEVEGKVFIIVDGGMNDLIRPALYQSHHQIVPVNVSRGAHEIVDVVGPLCESGDFFAQDRMLPRVHRGDLLALMCTGAYGFAMSSNYNGRLRPAEVLVDGSNVSVIREREMMEQLV